MGACGSHKLKTLLLLQIAAESYFSWIFFPMVLTKVRMGFLNFWNWNFNELFLFSLTWDPMGEKISTMLLFLQIVANSIQTFTVLLTVHTKLCSAFLKFRVSRIGHMLLLNSNGNPYMGKSIDAKLHFTSVFLNGQCQGHSDFESLYSIKELS